MSSQKPLIDVRGITKEYDNDGVVTRVLFGIDIAINEGDFVAIMGPSGSGKSTFMHILGFLDRPSKGTYLLKGKDVSALSDDELAAIRNESVGFVFQAFFLLPKTSVFENVRLPLLYTTKPHSDEDVMSAISAVGLSHRVQNLSSQLSGGEKQRVAIARALVNKPDIIFADEPTGNLDSKSGQQVMEILQDLNDQGKTIILVTHELDTARHAKRLIRLRDGLVVADEPITERTFAKNGELRK